MWMFISIIRGWKDKRRLLIIKGDDETMNQTLDDAVYNHRCDLAIRGVNLGKRSKEKRIKDYEYLHIGVGPFVSLT
jgi:hypothetical protein